MINWPTNLVLDIARRRSVVFVGAGVSMGAKDSEDKRPPSWEEFLKIGIERCSAPKKDLKKTFREKDYLGCCQLIKYKMGHEWINFVNEYFSIPNYKPSELHKELFRLDSGIVATSNFDKIYEKCVASLEEEFGSNLIVKKYYDDDLPRFFRGNEKQRLLMKIHGCIDSPDKMIFTREDYANIRNNYQNFYRSFESMVMLNTFVFFGCSFSDPDVALILEQYARSFSSAPPHYLVTGEKYSPEYRNMIENNYNIVILDYNKKDNHKELIQSVSDLRKMVENKRDNLSALALW
ncbi:MAG: SIR2 family protein [Rhodospirillales bacterium]